MSISDEKYDELAGASARIAEANAAEAQRKAERDPRSVRAEVYVCPTPGCGNYAGAKGWEGVDLGDRFTGPKVEDRGKLEMETGSPWRHSRAACPDCRGRGVAVERALVVVRVPVPHESPPVTPELPKTRS